MQFKLALLAVKSVEVSKKFYHDLFNQEVVMDLGWNVTFSGGFAIQENFHIITSLAEDSILKKSNNMELYFEVEDFDGFLQKLDKCGSEWNLEYVNRPMKHEWQQRVVRIYDPDYHIIEIGESMEVIAKRYLCEGYTVEETSKKIQHPIDFVEKCKLKL